MEIVFSPGELCDPFEYFCSGCGQMRLSFVATDKCFNCGSDKIRKGLPGELDKEKLTKEWEASLA